MSGIRNGCHSLLIDCWNLLHAASNCRRSKKELVVCFKILRKRTVSVSRAWTRDDHGTLMQKFSDSSQLRSMALQHSLRGVPLSKVCSCRKTL